MFTPCRYSPSVMLEELNKISFPFFSSQYFRSENKTVVFLNLSIKKEILKVRTSFCNVCVWAWAWSNWVFNLLASCTCWFSREPSLSCRTSSLFSRDSRLLVRTWLCSLVLHTHAEMHTDVVVIYSAADHKDFQRWQLYYQSVFFYYFYCRKK